MRKKNLTLNYVVVALLENENGLECFADVTLVFKLVSTRCSVVNYEETQVSLDEDGDVSFVISRLDHRECFFASSFQPRISSVVVLESSGYQRREETSGWLRPKIRQQNGLWLRRFSFSSITKFRFLSEDLNLIHTRSPHVKDFASMIRLAMRGLLIGYYFLGANIVEGHERRKKNLLNLRMIC